MRAIKTTLILFMLLCVLSMGANGASKEKPQVENVIFMMTDGLRWHEVFKGANADLLETGAGATPARLQFVKNTPQESREALMPFVWKTMAKQGQVFGNKDKGSSAIVINDFKFSYPGYSETLCGFADSRVDSNKKIPNPNQNVFEWLNAKPQFQGKVAAFGAWDLFPYIINRERSGVFVNAGYEPMPGKNLSKTYQLLNRLKAETIQYWKGEPFDSLTLETGLEYLKTKKPRVFYMSLGETDEWGHDGRYDLYLESAHKADDAVKIVWETAQSMRKYRDKTLLIFSADHGRGDEGDGWKSHGVKHPGSESIWMAYMGPGVEPLGERSQTDTVSASQIAATLSAALGQDYCADVTRAGKPINDVLKKK
jgi:hypothetical protein